MPQTPPSLVVIPSPVPAVIVYQPDSYLSRPSALQEKTKLDADLEALTLELQDSGKLAVDELPDAPAEGLGAACDLGAIHLPESEVVTLVQPVVLSTCIDITAKECDDHFISFLQCPWSGYFCQDHFCSVPASSLGVLQNVVVLCAKETVLPKCTAGSELHSFSVLSAAARGCPPEAALTMSKEACLLRLQALMNPIKMFLSRIRVEENFLSHAQVCGNVAQMSAHNAEVHMVALARQAYNQSQRRTARHALWWFRGKKCEVAVGEASTLFPTQGALHPHPLISHTVARCYSYLLAHLLPRISLSTSMHFLPLCSPTPCITLLRGTHPRSSAYGAAKGALVILRRLHEGRCQRRA